MKELTVIIPAYNVEKYIETCLNSLLLPEIFQDVEVIVIDDGSKDGTFRLISAYEKEYPEFIRVVSKKNGGHGSVINLGVTLAKGRYFKILDADDWLINIPRFLQELKQTEADVVITGYQTIHQISGRILDFPSICTKNQDEITMDELLEVYWDISSCCSFHGVTYKTEPYVRNNIHVTEGIFYEDQEFSCYPFAYIQSIRIFPFYFYQYLVGNGEQSVSFQNQVKRLDHIHIICVNMMKNMTNPSLSTAASTFYLRKITVVVVSYFAVAFVKNPDKKQGRQQGKAFEETVRTLCPMVLERIKKKLLLLKIMNLCSISPALYQGLLDTNLYKKIRKIWTSE